MDERRDERGPMDPTRKLLKVFGVKVTEYEEKTDALIAKLPAASADERAAIQSELLVLSAELANALRDVNAHVLERQARVLGALKS
jgi:hypothetical protein